MKSDRKKTSNAQRPTSSVELKSRAATHIFLYRNYWNAEQNHCPYVNKLHDLKDHPLFQLYQLKDLFEKAGIKDGEEVEITVRATGRRPFGNRIWKLIAPHQYGPIDQASGNRKSKIENRK